MKILTDLFKKKNCTTCTFFSKRDMDGHLDNEHGFGYCAVKMDKQPGKDKLCVKWKS